MHKNRLMLNLKLNVDQFQKLCNSKGIAFKDDYSDSEVATLTGKGFTPQPKSDRTTETQSEPETIDDASLALVGNPIAAVSANTQALAVQMVDAATLQANGITQMVLSYPNLVAQLVEQNLQQAVDTGRLGKSLPLPSFSIDADAGMKQLTDCLNQRRHQKQLTASQGSN